MTVRVMGRDIPLSRIAEIRAGTIRQFADQAIRFTKSKRAVDALESIKVELDLLVQDAKEDEETTS